jgi:hypothetical protein
LAKGYSTYRSNILAVFCHAMKHRHYRNRKALKHWMILFVIPFQFLFLSFIRAINKDCAAVWSG